MRIEVPRSEPAWRPCPRTSPRPTADQAVGTGAAAGQPDGAAVRVGKMVPHGQQHAAAVGAVGPAGDRHHRPGQCPPTRTDRSQVGRSSSPSGIRARHCGLHPGSVRITQSASAALSDMTPGPRPAGGSIRLVRRTYAGDWRQSRLPGRGRPRRPPRRRRRSRADPTTRFRRRSTPAFPAARFPAREHCTVIATNTVFDITRRPTAFLRLPSRR